ncbi:helix-turn-helix domain-containing protein [Paenibacillus sp. NPDC057967]|uniref:helix-turn-helix domain-containing protein n=1 Tax=Paenibacillus sp. NPDC057967 TaxID=3346293 RepID=UPI0036D797CD
MSSLRKLVGDRVKEQRSLRGWNQEVLADNAGLTKSAVSKIENGNVSVAFESIHSICKAFEISIDELLDGQTPKSAASQQALFFDEKREVVSHIDSLIAKLDEIDQSFIKRYIDLAISHRNHIDAAMNAKESTRLNDESSSIVNKESDKSKDDEELEEVRPVPLVGKTAAGIGKTYYEFIHGYMPVPKIYTKGTCFVMEVDGDSMTGDGIESGDFVVIRQQPSVESKDIALLKINDEEMTLKRIYQSNDELALLSSNASHPERIVPASKVQVIGKFIYRIPRDLGRELIREELF